MARPKEADQRQSVHGLDEYPYLHILERDGFTCQLCGKRRNLEVHHICPRARGGDDAEANLVAQLRQLGNSEKNLQPLCGWFRLIWTREGPLGSAFRLVRLGIGM